MARYILKRLILIIPILIAVSIAVFLLLSLSPNDPALLILGANASEADLEMFREQHGLNLPLVTQYLNYMSGLLQGDMGTSYKTMQDVSLMIGIRIWNTLILCAGACLLITILGVILGIAMALRQKDIPVVMGSVMISALLMAVVNLITDIAYAYVDPRIKSQYVGKKRKKKTVHVEEGVSAA